MYLLAGGGVSTRRTRVMNMLSYTWSIKFSSTPHSQPRVSVSILLIPLYFRSLLRHNTPALFYDECPFDLVAYIAEALASAAYALTVAVLISFSIHGRRLHYQHYTELRTRFLFSYLLKPKFRPLRCTTPVKWCYAFTKNNRISLAPQQQRTTSPLI
jgi:hypothetical protein